MGERVYGEMAEGTHSEATKVWPVITDIVAFLNHENEELRSQVENTEMRNG